MSTGLGLEVFAQKDFERALRLAGLRDGWMAASRQTERRLKVGYGQAGGEVNPGYERQLLDLGYGMEGGQLVGPGVTQVSSKSRGGVGSVSSDGTSDSYREMLLAVRKAGRQCSPRQAVVWAEENRLLRLEEIDRETVPGPMAVGMLERAHCDRNAFNDCFNKLLARAEMEDKEKFETSGESQLAALEPLSEGLLDPQREGAG